MVFQAGLISFFRTLLIIAAVYFGFRLLFRYLVPFILQRFIRKQQQQYYEHTNKHRNGEEGEVRVKSKAEKKTSNSDLGEYVDYEEVK